MLYAAKFASAHFNGLKLLNAYKRAETFKLTASAMSVATEMMAEVRMTAKSEWVKRALNMMPRLSPQETMQKQLKAMTKNRVGVWGRLTARQPRKEKRLERISKGISIAAYWRKKDSIE
jgi:hypothetical protein